MAAEKYLVTAGDGKEPHPDDGVAYHLTRCGSRWIQPILPAVLAVDTITHDYQRLFDNLGELDESLHSVRLNPKFSAFGKAEKIEEMSAAVLADMAEVNAKVDDRERTLNELEAKALAPDPLPPGDLAAVMGDWEIRQWFMSHPKETDRLQLIAKLDARSHAALMRSPIPIGDDTLKVVRENWEEMKRAQDPEQHVRIAVGRKAVEWMRRGLAPMAAATLQTTGLQGDRLLWRVASSMREDAQRGLGVFGFSRRQVAEMKLRAAAEGHLKRAA